MRSRYRRRTFRGLASLSDRWTIKRINEDKILLSHNLFFWNASRCMYLRTYHPESVFGQRLIYFRLHFGHDCPPPSSYLSLPLSLSLSLPFGLYSVGRTEYSITAERVYEWREISERCFRNCGGDSLSSLLSPLLSSNNRRIRSTGLVLGMSCEWSEWPWMGKYTRANISACVNLVLSTGFLIGRLQLRFVGPSPWNLLNTVASERERRDAESIEVVTETSNKSKRAREKLPLCNRLSFILVKSNKQMNPFVIAHLYFKL